MDDFVRIGGRDLTCRLFLGTGKYTSYDLIPQVIRASGTQVVTVALRRIDFDTPRENMVKYLPAGVILMTNTSGARNAAEAVRIARMARAADCGDWVKIDEQWQPRERFVKVEEGMKTRITLKFHAKGKSYTFIIDRDPSASATAK